MIDKILVIGLGSLTGSRFIELLDKNIEVWGAGGSLDAGSNVKDFKNLDITNPQEVDGVIAAYPGKFLINFAGATAVGDIEKNKPSDPNNQEELNNNLAYKINVLGTKSIIESAKKHAKFPIFLSTGYVFDGKSGPYSEDDPIAQSPDDVSFYAWTKALAEKEIKESGIESLVIRISYPYRSNYEAKGDFARNFLKIYDEIQSKVRESFPPLFTNQILTPTFVDDLAPGISLLIEKNQTGIFSIVSPDLTSPYEFCLELLKVAKGVENPESIITKGDVIDYEKSHPDAPKYPIKGGEKVDKIKNIGFTPTSWRDGIKKAFSK